MNSLERPVQVLREEGTEAGVRSRETRNSFSLCKKSVMRKMETRRRRRKRKEDDEEAQTGMRRRM